MTLLSFRSPRHIRMPTIEVTDARVRRDPTRTWRIRAKLRAEGDRRWQTLAQTLRQALIEHDLIGIGGVGRLPHGDKIEGFAAWLREELRHKIFGYTGSWLQPYVQQAAQLAQRTVVNGNVDPARVASMQTLAVSELRGIVEAAQQQITRAVTHCMMANATPTQTANKAAGVIKTMRLRTRAMSEYLIAKTHATSTLSAFRSVGVTHVGITPEQMRKPRIKQTEHGKVLVDRDADLDEVDVITAGDNFVCQVCEDISDGGPYPIDEAEDLIPAHIFCRCAFVPIYDLRFANVHEQDALDEGPGHPFRGNQYTSGEGGGLVNAPMRSQSIRVIAWPLAPENRKYTEVLVNPTERALLNMAKEDPEQAVRHLEDEHGNQFFWNASQALHGHVQRALRLAGATGIDERTITGGMEWYVAKHVAPMLRDKLKQGRDVAKSAGYYGDALDFDPDQPRDPHGRWTLSGGGPSGETWQSVAESALKEWHKENPRVAARTIKLNKDIDQMMREAEQFTSYRDWYEQHRPLARELFGEHEPLFEKFLAAASINAAGAWNVTKALSAMQHYLLGGKFDTPAEYSGIMPVERTQYQHIERNEPISGPKIVPFHQALMGDWDQTPADRHMKNLLFQHPTTSGGNYSQPDATKAVVGAMARKMGWKPAELQAVLWVVQKAREEKGLSGTIFTYKQYLEEREARIRSIIHTVKAFRGRKGAVGQDSIDPFQLLEKAADAYRNARLLLTLFERIQSHPELLNRIIANDFDPDQARDPQGRWTEVGGGAGYEFYSPAVGQARQLNEAIAGLSSNRQRILREASQAIDIGLDLPSRDTSAVGAWSDGAENSIVSAIVANPPWDKLVVSGAMKGHIADQKAVLVFKQQDGGTSALYQMQVPESDPQKLHENLLADGVAFHTIVPHGIGSEVYVADLDGSAHDAMAKAAERYDAQVTYQRGQAEFIGTHKEDGTDREQRDDARRAYEEIIKQSSVPRSAEVWSRVHHHWGQTLSAVTDYDPDQPRDPDGRWSSGGPGPGPESRQSVMVERRGDAIVVYHGTSQAAVDSIKREGLKPKGGKGADEWAAMHGMKTAHQQFTSGDRRMSVYFANSRQSALSFAQLAAEVRNSKPAMFEVDLPISEASKVKMDEAGEAGMLRYNGEIKPEWLKEVEIPDDIIKALNKIGPLVQVERRDRPGESVEDADTKRIYAIVFEEPEQQLPLPL